MPGVDNIKWSKNPYKVKELYGKLVETASPEPMVIRVSAGVCGDSELETLPINQVIFIHTYKAQTRVVATNKQTGRFMSIPEKYPLKFEISSKKGRLWTMSEILRKYSRFPLTVQFSPEVREGFKVASNTKKAATESISEIQLERVYEQVYLVGYSIIEGRLHSTPLLIPRYMNALMEIGEGLKGKSNDDWNKFVSGMQTKVQFQEIGAIEGDTDILVYSGCMEEEDDENIYATYAPAYALSHPEKEAYEELERNQKMSKEQNYNYVELSKRPKPIQQKGAAVQNELQAKLTLRGVPKNGNSSALLPQSPHTNEKPSTGPKPRRSISLPVGQKNPDNANDTIVYETCGSITKTPLPATPNAEVLSNTGQAQKSFNTISDIPSDLSGLSVADVSTMLGLLNLHQFITPFNKKQIDGTMLLELDVDDFKEIFKMDNIDAKRLNKVCKDGYRPST